MVVRTAAMTLTFGGRSVGEIGPAPRCEAPVTATATVTGPAGAAAPTGNVTLANASRSSLLDPFPHHLDRSPVQRCGSVSNVCVSTTLGRAYCAESGKCIPMLAVLIGHAAYWHVSA